MSYRLNKISSKSCAHGTFSINHFVTSKSFEVNSLCSPPQEGTECQPFFFISKQNDLSLVFIYSETIWFHHAHRKTVVLMEIIRG